MEDLYYCTKKMCFPTRIIIKHVKDLFDNTEKDALDIFVIYNYLQEKLNVTSVGMKNLVELLHPNKNGLVNRSQIETIYYKYHNEKKSVVITTITDEFIDNIKESIHVLGYEFINYFLSSNGISVYNFLVSCSNGTNYIDKPLFGESSRYLREFLCSFNEKELLTLLDNKEAINELFSIYIQEKKEKEDEQQFIGYIRDKILNISKDNYPFKLSYVLMPNLTKLLANNGINMVGDFVNLTDSQIKLFRGQEELLYINLLKHLGESLPNIFRDDFMGVVTQRKFNNKPAPDWKKYVEIMYLRIEGKTLTDAGKMYDLKRQRVGQIENKYLALFTKFYYNRKGSLSGLLRAYSNNKFYITADEIKILIGDYYKLFIYLLRKINTKDINYIDELNIFLFVDELNWYDETIKIASDLPDSISIESLEGVTAETCGMFSDLGIQIPYDYIKTIISLDYKLNGKIYSRARIPLFKKYEIVLRKFFPDGIFVYEENDMQKFKEKYIETFEDDRLPDNNRAIYSRIADCAIICDRGKYKPIKEPLISDNLLNELCSYIDESSKDIFMTNTLFYLFEEKLRNEGIDNKYYLQGVLHYKLANRYYFKRDYISKSKEITNIYSSVIQYIKDADRIVTKAEVFEEFPGLPAIVLGLALQDENMINGYGLYVHKDWIMKNGDAVEELRSVICEMVSDSEIHSSSDLLNILSLMHHNILDVFSIDSRYYLFSVIEGLFQNEFSLSRPFIAKKGIVIGKTDERIRDYFEIIEDELPVDDFADYMRDNSFVMYSILDTLNSFNDVVILKDKQTLIKLDKTGLNKYSAQYVDEFIDDLIGKDDFLSGEEITGYNFLPKINIKWNEWILYSVVMKWSSKYKAIISNDQFRSSYPIFIRKDNPATNRESLIDYLKRKNNYNEVELQRFLMEKNLLK